uniref:hypothetical protein n=1 Tax=Altererythrobacter segetis TaxID=1104773 RepID=UPI00140A41E5|nr:hypothetical protein [Altererythrobacter segetis]
MSQIIIQIVLILYCLFNLVRGVRTGRVFTGAGDASKASMPEAFYGMMGLYLLLAAAMVWGFFALIQ